MNAYRVLKAKCAAFLEDQSGIVAPIFGLMAIVLFVSMGAAVDYSRWMHARNQTITAMDAGVLAGGKALQNGDSEAVVLAAANSFYDTNKSQIVSNDTIQFVVGDDGKSITATGNADVVTPFLRLMDIEKLPVLADTGVDHSKSELQVGGNAEKNIEITLVLDVTGSMGTTKLEDMQDAATDLINTVIWDDQSEFTSRVALVPFSHAVNVGSNYFTAMTSYSTDSVLTRNDLPTPEPSVVQRVLHAAVRGFNKMGFGSPAFAKNGNSNGNGNGNSNGNSNDDDDDDDDDDDGVPNVTYLDPCVVERSGTEAQSDAAPGFGKYVGAYDIEKQGHWMSSYSCKPADVAIEPLTSNKTVLTDKIEDFVSSGNTAGHIGIQVGWYTLSPNWSTVWPTDSAPAAYTDTTTEKIALLMTDGNFNTYFNDGSDDSGEQAEDLCAAMRTAGITIYTVAFEVDDDSQAAEVMQSCASDPGNYYDADNGEELRQAFRDISLRISDLRLTH